MPATPVGGYLHADNGNRLGSIIIITLSDSIWGAGPSGRER
jgi:hypothetical protein